MSNFSYDQDVSAVTQDTLKALLFDHCVEFQHINMLPLNTLITIQGKVSRVSTRSPFIVENEVKIVYSDNSQLKQRTILYQIYNM